MSGEREPNWEVPRHQVGGGRGTVWGEPCPTCFRRGSYSSTDPSAHYVAPSGHTIHRDDELGITWESCADD